MPDIIAPVITRIEVGDTVIEPKPPVIHERTFVYVLLGRLVFKVDDRYLDEPLDTSYPLYDIYNDEEVGMMQASYLQQTALRIPACYIDVYKDAVNNCLDKTLASIDIRPVLRLLVNNETYIHYLVGPVLMSDLICREGGQYFAFENDKDGKPVLYSGDTALQLRENIKHGITGCKNRVMTILHDSYFQAAIDKLLEYHLDGDICAVNTMHSEWKDPALAVVPDTVYNHKMHCEWCMSMGLDGKHNNSWNSDGNVYDNGSRTTKSNYINANHKHEE